MNGFANVINRYYIKRCFVFLRIPNAEYKEIAFYKDILFYLYKFYYFHRNF